MTRLSAISPIIAILYSEGRHIDALMLRIASTLQHQGCSLAGFVQRNQPRAGRQRCDMILEDLASGLAIAISEDRGPLARGCHLDVGELLRGTELGLEALEAGADLLIVNKFGKTEGEGGGFRPLIAEALQRDVPVLIAVPWRNIDSWRRFAGDMAQEVDVASLPSGTAGLLAALGFTVAVQGHASNLEAMKACP